MLNITMRRCTSALLPSQIVPLTKSFREFIRQISPLLWLANSSGGRRDRQHGSPMGCSIDRDLETALGAIRVLPKIGFNHCSKFGGRLQFVARKAIQAWSLR